MDLRAGLDDMEIPAPMKDKFSPHFTPSCLYFGAFNFDRKKKKILVLYDFALL
jgi:hypothetical protein